MPTAAPESRAGADYIMLPVILVSEDPLAARNNLLASIR
jgi:hypothetical protein